MRSVLPFLGSCCLLPWLAAQAAVRHDAMQQGRQLFAEARFAEAAAAFAQADGAAESAELQYNLALASWRAGDLPTAETAIEKYAALSKAPRTDLHAGLLGAVRFDEAQQLQQAAEAALAGTATDERAADPLQLLGQALVKAQQARRHFVRGAVAAGSDELRRNVERTLRLIDELQRRIEELKQQQEQQQDDKGENGDEQQDGDKQSGEQKPGEGSESEPGKKPAEQQQEQQPEESKGEGSQAEGQQRQEQQEQQQEPEQQRRSGEEPSQQSEAQGKQEPGEGEAAEQPEPAPPPAGAQPPEPSPKGTDPSAPNEGEPGQEPPEPAKPPLPDAGADAAEREATKGEQPSGQPPPRALSLQRTEQLKAKLDELDQLLQELRQRSKSRRQKVEKDW